MTLTEASLHLGIPVAQLKSWAAQRAVGFITGPNYIGHWRKPEYNQQDLDEWKAATLKAREENAEQSFLAGMNNWING